MTSRADERNAFCKVSERFFVMAMMMILPELQHHLPSFDWLFVWIRQKKISGGTLKKKTYGFHQMFEEQHKHLPEDIARGGVKKDFLTRCAIVITRKKVSRIGRVDVITKNEIR